MQAEVEIISPPNQSLIPQSNRVKSTVSANRHSILCGVCKSEYKQQVEEDYLDFVAVAAIAEAYGVKDDAIYRHINYYKLDQIRVQNTEKVLADVISRGFASHKEITPKVALGAVQELHKVTGRHVSPALHPQDAERADVDQKLKMLAILAQFKLENPKYSDDELRSFPVLVPLFKIIDG